MSRNGTNKTHNNENQQGGWYRSSGSGYTTYVWQKEWKTLTRKLGARIFITQNHKSIFGTTYHNNSTFWVCEWTGTKEDGSKWHYIMVFHSLKAAKELRDWRNCVVVDVINADTTCGVHVK